MKVKLNQFDTAQELNEVFAKRILQCLQKGIDTKGQAVIAVSGGSTPKPLFELLSRQNFPWDKVTITLVDDRWVDVSDDASNEKLVNENLLINKAIRAQFVGMKSSAADQCVNAFEGQANVEATMQKLALPFDVVILGMGEDGHTASIFPCSAQVKEGLDKNNSNLTFAAEPTTAPHQRMSFTYSALMKSGQIFLHLVGENKKPVLEKALNGDDIYEMPIRAFMHQTETPFEIMFANNK